MVEQDISQASPVFSDLRNSNDKYQNNFVADSTKSLDEEPLSISLLNAGNTEESNYILQDVLPKEEFLFDDSSINEQYLNVSKLEGLWQPLSDMYSTPSDSYFEASSPLSFWGSCPLDLEAMKIDEVFQVDKDAIFQSPTLAELNANDESLFDSFDCFDVFLPTGDKATSNKSDLNSEFKISPFNLADQSKQIISVNSNLEKEYPLKADTSVIKQELNLISTEPDTVEKQSLNDVKLQTVPASVNEKKKQDRSCKLQVTKRIKSQLDEESLSNEDICTEKFSENSSQLPHLSNNDHFDSDEDSEVDGDYSSDADEESDDEIKSFSAKYLSVNRINLEKKKSRYFWQYNMQSKGPKGPKMKLTNKSSNVHDLPGVSDPVFSSNCPIEGVKHSGKARRGDGNDLTPNPKKLYNIGIELEKLNCIIDGLIPVNELPMNARTKSRKEKNKLASRACRLKKKAQHEANKLKLFGLQQEQKCLLKFVSEAKKLLKNRVQNFKLQKEQSTVAAIESLQMKKSMIKVAGCSADFVNNVLKTVASGDEFGGLNIPLRREK